MSGVAVLLSVLIGALVLISLVLSIIVFMNSGLSARSLFYSLTAFCVAVYSIVGYIWTTWDGVDENYMFTVLKISEAILPLLTYAMFMGALTFTMIKRSTYTKIGLLGAVPIIVTAIAVWTWNTSKSMTGISVSLPEGGGEPTAVFNPIGNIWIYIIMLAFIGLTFAAFAVAIKRQPNAISKKIIRTAMIGGIIAVVFTLGFNSVVGIIPYAHSIGHLGLFVFIFASYRAFVRDYSIE